MRDDRGCMNGPGGERHTTALVPAGAADPVVAAPGAPYPAPPPPPATPVGALRAIAAEGGLERIRVVAWRDLDDPEAGGSELHAHHIARLWASAGIGVELRTSAVRGAPRVVERDGYRAVRRGGRYAVFARTGLETVRTRARPGEGLVEIWNGMPFWSPVWWHGPRVVFLHHVHTEMWRMVLPRWMARMGEETERRVAPLLYRAARVITLSESSRQEIVDLLGLHPDKVTVVPPGVDPRFSPGSAAMRSSGPLVVAVGRLVPVKRFDLLLGALARAKRAVPELRAVILGDGYQRQRLTARCAELGATGWVSFTGRVTDGELVDWYRRAWVVASASLREGWGMTLSEAGACGTPAVASDIAGHRDAVVDGTSGLLANGEEAMAAALTRVLCDDALRARLAAGALLHASRFSWEAAARATLDALVEEACWEAGDQRYPLGLRPSLLP